jgi:nicotinamidase-related amidase
MKPWRRGDATRRLCSACVRPGPARGAGLVEPITQDENRIRGDDVYGQLLTREDRLLLLFVDVQKPVLDLCARQDLVVKNCAALIDIASIFEIPVLFSQHDAKKLGGFLPKLVAKVRHPAIRDKLEFSGFDNEGIAQALEAMGRRTILLTGLATHVCIFHTGAHVARLGYRVHVAGDAVTSRSPFNWETGLRVAKGQGL